MELASEERNRLMEKEKAEVNNGEMSVDRSVDSSCWESQMGENSYSAGRDQIDVERRRLEKVARRQQKELLRMLVSSCEHNCDLDNCVHHGANFSSPQGIWNEITGN